MRRSAELWEAPAMSLTRWVVVFVAITAVVPSRAAVPLILLVLLAAGASRWSVGRAVRGLEVHCEAPRWATHGQRLEARAEVRNRSRLPAPWVEFDVPCGLGLGRTAPHREALPLSPGERVTRRVRLVATSRGRHHVGPPRLRVGDVLGANAATLAPGEAAEVIVFPRILPLARLGLPATAATVTLPSPQSALVDPTDVAGVRDYEPGDALATVHWPATARAGRLAVKRYQRAEARDTLVCLDLSQGAYPPPGRPVAELGITAAASIAHHVVVGERQAAGLVTAAVGAPGAVTRLPPRQGRARLRALLEHLALVEHATGPPPGALLAELSPAPPPGSTVVFVTGTLDAGALAGLLRLSSRGVAVAVVVVGPGASGVPAVPGLPVHRVPDLPAMATVTR